MIIFQGRLPIWCYKGGSAHISLALTIDCSCLHLMETSHRGKNIEHDWTYDQFVDTVKKVLIGKWLYSLRLGLIRTSQSFSFFVSHKHRGGRWRG